MVFTLHAARENPAGEHEGEMMRLAGLLLMGAVVAVTIACSKKTVRTRDEIFAERIALPALYLTAKTNKRVTAPGNSQVFVDKATGELCWRAMTCDRQVCPGKNAAGEPLVFINPNPAYFIQPDDAVGVDTKQMQNAAAETLMGCPACLKSRNVHNESREQKEYYLSLVRPHVLPETAKKLEALEAESVALVTKDKR